MLLVKKSVLSLIENKQHIMGLPTFKLPACTKIVYDSCVKHYFDVFGIWLLGNRIEFSGLYVSQGISLWVLCGYGVQINM